MLHDPAVHPRFSAILGCPAPPVGRVWLCFRQIAPNRAERVSGGLFLFTFSKQEHKSPHGQPQGVTKLYGFLSELTNPMAAKNLEGTTVFTEIEKALIFR